MALASLRELRRANWDWGWGAASDIRFHTQWFHSTGLGLTPPVFLTLTLYKTSGNLVVFAI